MSKKEKTEYQLKVDELKGIIKSMNFDDVVKLRKNADGIIAGVLKSMLKSERTQINKEFDKQKKEHQKQLDAVDKLEIDLGIEPKNSGANAKK